MQARRFPEMLRMVESGKLNPGMLEGDTVGLEGASDVWAGQGNYPYSGTHRHNASESTWPAFELPTVRRLGRELRARMKAILRSVTPLIPSGGGLAESHRLLHGPHGLLCVWQGAGMAGIRRDASNLTLSRTTIRRGSTTPAFQHRSVRSGGAVSGISSDSSEDRSSRREVLGPAEFT